MYVQINETGGYDAAFGVNRLACRSLKHTGCCELSHQSVAQYHIHVAIDAAGRIDDAAPCDEQRAPFGAYHRALFITVARMAIRVLTPLATCSCTRDCGPSATSLANSSPRTMGPGCITIASGLASFMRCGVIWNFAM